MYDGRAIAGFIADTDNSRGGGAARRRRPRGCFSVRSANTALRIRRARLSLSVTVRTRLDAAAASCGSYWGESPGVGVPAGALGHHRDRTNPGPDYHGSVGKAWEMRVFAPKGIALPVDDETSAGGRADHNVAESVPDDAAERLDVAAEDRGGGSVADGQVSRAGADRVLAAEDRLFAAQDRRAAALDRRDADEHEAAALARDEAAGARELWSDEAAEMQQAAADRLLATRDRSAAALDRHNAASRDAAAAARDKAAEARDLAALSARQATQAAVDLLADRAGGASASDRREAASDRRKASDYLRSVYRDDLTGTLRRDVGRDQLRQVVARAHQAVEPLVVAYLDVDHLKQVNDTKGHPAGDRLLQEVGAALRQGLRPYDLVVRYGGDEFVCALPGARLPQAERRFTEIDDMLSTVIAGASVTVGLAELRTDESLEEVIGRSDRDMYDRREVR